MSRTVGRITQLTNTPSGLQPRTPSGSVGMTIRGPLVMTPSTLPGAKEYEAKIAKLEARWKELKWQVASEYAIYHWRASDVLGAMTKLEREP